MTIEKRANADGAAGSAVSEFCVGPSGGHRPHHANFSVLDTRQPRAQQPRSDGCRNFSLNYGNGNFDLLVY